MFMWGVVLTLSVLKGGLFGLLFCMGVSKGHFLVPMLIISVNGAESFSICLLFQYHIWAMTDQMTYLLFHLFVDDL